MSVFYDILYAIKTRLQTISQGPPVHVRKRAIILESDSLPVIVVSPASEIIGLDTFKKMAGIDYTVQVTLVQAGNRIYESDTQDWLQLRETVRRLLYQPELTGISDVIAMELDMQPAFESVVGATSNYDISGMTITYRVLEERIT